MQAEKDLHKLVKNNEDVTIGNNRTKSVKGNDVLSVIKNRTKTVLGNEVQSIALNKRVSVGINRATQVGSIDSTMVGGTHLVTISPPGEGLGDLLASLTRTILTANRIEIATKGGAKIVLEDKKISLDADEITLTAKKITIKGDEVSTTGKNSLQIETTAGATKVKSSTTTKIEGALICIEGGVVDVKGNPIKLNS